MPIIRKRGLPKKTSITCAAFFNDEKMPWLSDVLGEQLDKLVRVSSSPTHGARSRRLIEPYEKGLHWLLKTQNLITKDLQ